MTGILCAGCGKLAPKEEPNELRPQPIPLCKPCEEQHVRELEEAYASAEADQHIAYPIETEGGTD